MFLATDVDRLPPCHGSRLCGRAGWGTPASCQSGMRPAGARGSPVLVVKVRGQCQHPGDGPVGGVGAAALQLLEDGLAQSPVEAPNQLQDNGHLDGINRLSSAPYILAYSLWSEWDVTSCLCPKAVLSSALILPQAATYSALAPDKGSISLRQAWPSLTQLLQLLKFPNHCQGNNLILKDELDCDIVIGMSYSWLNNNNSAAYRSAHPSTRPCVTLATHYELVAIAPPPSLLPNS
ncbi:hypothetical protein HaLaN_24386 [Haematococcus lacustris]|uniref:Uncharacterized protein n=1 Tax=Haematococcus lacustris TaxID=44745 RepID=A0A6A0A2U1_HAELA|nr:hypothetical protein HaLaN_24386 [Haematococcus lacustris]